MTKERAIAKVIEEMRLTDDYTYFIGQTMNRLGCGRSMDLETVRAIEQVIRNELCRS